MATLVLTAAGSALGSAALPAGVGFLGTTISGAAIGSGLGGALGSALDQRLFGPGAQVRQGPRLTNLDVVTSTEGAPIPRVFGRMRLAGQVIWATRFKETATDSSAGGKGGGPTSRDFTYSVSVAIALCEGPIAGIGRLWADGEPMDLTGVTHRLHHGHEDQPPDPLIAALTPDTPAYAGTAYIVFEDLPLTPYGNRLPQITVEVRRLPVPPAGHEDGPNLPALIEGVALSPGSGEFALATRPVRRITGEGSYASENENNTGGQPDFLTAIDQLEATAPNCRSALLIVSWFGTDLRAGHCQLHPGTDRVTKETDPLAWLVSGESRTTAHAISTDGNANAVYGGTPADISVFQAIQELTARGISVTFYPFILMDIPADNPMSQPAFPWRGRIAGAGQGDIDAFFGTASPSDFAPWTGSTIPYSGPDERTLRRMILHYAHLCAAAGGVEAFCIGSELRGITTTRADGAYPAVAALRTLAADVRTILPNTKISYAADWSEYANHRLPAGQSPGGPEGDGVAGLRPNQNDTVTFHLDPLWADPNIDFIGIDNYLPLSDWRTGGDHLDAASSDSVYDLAYLTANVEGGEYADWFYATPEDRAAQTRTPLTDTAHGEHWVFGVKRLRDWWSNLHHNRPAGVREATPTAWQPQSKPIRFTETGCPAVDFGANQPNVFHDPKSSESAFPHHSRGVRDDTMQRRFLQAMLAHWQNDPMVARSYVWTWDTRPYPDYPLRTSVWSDGPAYDKGHWITGRLDAAPLAELVAEICASAGETRIDVSRLHDLVHGYTIDRTMSARDALAPLMLVYGFDALESDGVIRFIPRGAAPVATLNEADLVEADDPFTLTRAQETDLPRAVRLGYIRADAEYRRGTAEATLEPTASNRIDASDHAIALPGGKAQAAANRWLSEAHVAKDSAAFALPPSRLALEPGDTITLVNDGNSYPHRLAAISEADSRQIDAIRVAPDLYIPSDAPESLPEPSALPLQTPVIVEFLDLPLLKGTESPAPHIAAFASPWPGAVALYSASSEADFALTLTVERPATLGRTLTPLTSSAPSRWSQTSVDIKLSSGSLRSRDRLSTLAGANAAALRTPSGAWEVIQFREASLTAPQTYRLTGLLRGQAGTEPLITDLPAGTRFVLITDALKQLPLTAEDIDREAHYRYGPANLPFDAEPFRATTHTPSGAALRPYAPAHLRTTTAANGDLSITWTRRSRTGGDSLQNEPPIGEEKERYLVEISDPSGPLRSVETTTPATTYTAAQQSTDAATAPLTIRIAQLSARTGPGFFAGISA